VLSLYVIQGVNYLTPLLVLPYLLRILQPVGYGIVIFAQAFINYVRIFTNFGFNFSATRDVSLARGQRGELAKIFWVTLTAKGVLLLTSLVVVVPAVLLIPILRQHAAVIGISGFAVCGSIVIPQWYFQGIGRIRQLAIIQAISNLFMVAGAFLLVHSRADELQAAGVLALPLVLAGVASLVVLGLSRLISWHRPTSKEVWGAIRSSGNLFIANAATSLYVNSNVFFIGIICGAYQVALYSLANRIALAATGVLSPIVTAAFPRASIAFEHSVKEGIKFTRSISRYFALVAIALSCALMLFARPIILVLGGVRFLGAIPVVRIMALLPVAIGTAMILSQIIMVNMKMTRRMSHIYIVVGVLSVALLLPLSSLYGAQGGAVSLVIVEMVGPLLMLIAIRRRMRLGSRCGECAE